MDWQNILQEIEDILIPHYEFDIYERGMYYYLLNKTRIRSIETVIIPLSKISQALNCSDWQSRKTIRQLADKGCIELEQTRKGHSVKVFLPEELDIPITATEKKEPNIEEIDFFKGRAYVQELLNREQGNCFYCLSEISTKNCELDHVVSQQKGGNNSYKNIVTSCHKCNTTKLASDAHDFIRGLYRKGLLNETEFEDRQSAVEALKNGELKPQL